MKITRKLRKLVDPDIIESTREHLRRLKHPVDTAKILARLEREGDWEALQQKYPRGAAAINRWADAPFWIKRNVERAQDLSLDRPPARHLLDLGCGGGYFLYVARQLGHSGIGLDMDGQPIFRDLLQLTKVERTIHRLAPLTPLPPPDARFNLVTSFLTCFHRLERQPDGDWETWKPEQWQFFLDDVRTHHLAPGGTLLLEFHPQQNGELYPADVAKLFRQNNARFFRSKVYLRG